jgi:hypothetical protein
MYVHEIYTEGNLTQIVHSEETIRPSGLVVVRRLGAIHILHPATQSTILELPISSPVEMKPEDFKDSVEAPRVRLTADTIQGFSNVGKSEIPPAIREIGPVTKTNFLLRGDEQADGTRVPAASESEISAMREIFTSFQRALTTPSMASTADTVGTGFYL